MRQGLGSIAHIGNGAAQVLRNIGQAAVERRKGAIKYIVQILIQQLCRILHASGRRLNFACSLTCKIGQTRHLFIHSFH